MSQKIVRRKLVFWPLQIDDGKWWLKQMCNPPINTNSSVNPLLWIHFSMDLLPFIQMGIMLLFSIIVMDNYQSGRKVWGPGVKQEWSSWRPSSLPSWKIVLRFAYLWGMLKSTMMEFIEWGMKPLMESMSHEMLFGQSEYFCEERGMGRNFYRTSFYWKGSHYRSQGD